MRVTGTDTIALEISVRQKGAENITRVKQRVDQAKASMMDWLKTSALFGVGFSAMTGLLNKGRQAIANVVGATEEFDFAWRDVTALVGGADEAIAGVEDRLLGMAGPLGAATELNRAYWLAQSSGITDVEESLFAVEQAAKAAKAGQAELNSVLDLGTTVLNAYGMDVKELPLVYDMMFETNRRAKTSIEYMSRSYGEFIGTAAAVKVSFAELNAATVAMTLGGINTSKSMTALKAIIANIAKPTKEAEETAVRLGIQYNLAAIKSKGFAGFLQDLTTAVRDDAQAQADLFGSVEAFNAIAILTSKEGIKRYQEALDAMGKSQGNTQRAFEEQMKSWKYTWQGLKNEVQAIFISHLLPVLRSAAEWVKENADAITAWVKGAINVFKTVIGLLWKFKDVIVIAGTAWLAYFTISKIRAWGGAFLDVMGRGIGGLKTFGGGIVRMIDSFRLARTFGVGTFGSIKSALDNVTPRIVGLTGKIGLLQTSLKNLGLIGLAAFAGWKFGRWIGKVTGLEKELQNAMVPKLEMYEKMSAYKNMTRDQYQDAQRREKVIALAREYGIYERKLKDVYIALGKNADAYERLDDRSQTIVDRLSRMNEVMEQNAAVNNVMAYRTFETAKALGMTNDALVKAFAKTDLIRPFELDMKKVGDTVGDAGKAAKEAQKKFDDYAESLGLLTKTGMKEVRDETDLFIKTVDVLGDQLKGNADLQENVWEKSKELIQAYTQAGKEVPPQLQEINDRLSKMIHSYEMLRKIGVVETLIGAVPGSPVGGIAMAIDLVIQYEENLEQVKYTLEAIRIQMQMMLGIPMPDFFRSMPGVVGNVDDLVGTTGQLAAVFQEVSRTGSQVIDVLAGMGILGGKTAASLKGLLDGVTGIGAGLEQLERAAAKGGFWGFLGKIGGYASIAVSGLSLLGSVVGGIIGLFKGDGIGEAIKRETDWMNLNQQLKDSIRELAEEIGNTHAATSFYLSDILQQTTITYQNFGQWMRRAEEILISMDNRYMTQAEAARELGQSFSYLAGEAERLGIHGHAAMIQTIRNLRNRGMEVADVQAYLIRQQEDYAGAFSDFVSRVTDQSSFSRALAHAREYMNFMKAEGASMLQIVTAIGPDLDRLMDMASAQGWEITGLSELLGLREFAVENENILALMDADLRMMQALGNQGYLNQHNFQGYQDSLYEYYQKLAGGEEHSKEALEAILPYLRQQLWYASQNNLELDEYTKSLVEKVKKEGYNLEVGKSQYQLQLEQNALMKDFVEIMKRVFGITDDTADAFRNLAKNAASAYDQAARFSNLPGVTISTTQTDTGGSKPDFFAASGFQKMLTRPTDIFVDGKHIKAGESGPELFSITPKADLSPMKMPAASIRPVNGGAKIEIKIEIKNDMPIQIVVGDARGLDTDELSEKVSAAFDDNLRGFQDKIREMVVVEIARALGGYS